MENVNLAVINITSWVGQCSDAEHCYGELILINQSNVDTESIVEWNLKYIGGEHIELRREITLEEAQALDIKNQNFGMYQRHWRNGEKTVDKFNELHEVVDAGMRKYHELGLTCPLINLYEGEKYDETIIYQPQIK